MGASCQPGSALNKFFIFLGKLSYPLYITHNPVTKIVIHALKFGQIDLPDVVSVTLCCLTAVVAALLLLRLWDEPLRIWLCKRNQRSKPEPAVA